MRYKTALLIGRFQPFHFGHLYLIKKALTVSDNLIIGIGSSNRTDVKNPLPWQMRRKMIEKVIKKEKLNGKITKIIPLKDFFHDEKWLNNVVKKTGGFDLVVGNNDWVNRIMRDGGKKVMRVPYYKRYLYEGEKIRRLMNENKEWRSRVPKYLAEDVKIIIDKIKCKHIVIGGTFDHFHRGHEELIKSAFKAGNRVTIGVATTKLYAKKPLSKSIETFETRKKSVIEFLKQKKWLPRSKIISFSEFTGGADKKKDIDAIVVSKMTLLNAIKINDLRVKNRLDPLKIIVIKDLLVRDGQLLSSERIRMGEINREGNVYRNYFRKTLFLPASLREELRKPLGTVFKRTGEIIKFSKAEKPIMTIAVGDIIALELEKKGFIPDVKIIDFRSRRRTLFYKDSLPEGLSLINKQGTINTQSVKAINSAIKKFLSNKKPQTVVVVGEEDLLALPAIMLSPLNSLILYGHWKLGVIGVKITEGAKKIASKIINKFN